MLNRARQVGVAMEEIGRNGYPAWVRCRIEQGWAAIEQWSEDNHQRVSDEIDGLLEVLQELALCIELIAQFPPCGD